MLNRLLGKRGLSRITLMAIPFIAFTSTGCGLEGPAVQQLGLVVAGVGATAAGVSAFADISEAGEEAKQTELLRQTEDIRRMSSDDRNLFDQLQGEWTFFDPCFDVRCGYIFEFNGEVIQFDPESRQIIARGAFVVTRGRVRIRWLGGGEQVEVAEVRGFTGDELGYEIIAHTDQRQIGSQMQFTKVR